MRIRKCSLSGTFHTLDLDGIVVCLLGCAPDRDMVIAGATSVVLVTFPTALSNPLPSSEIEKSSGQLSSESCKDT